MLKHFYHRNPLLRNMCVIRIKLALKLLEAISNAAGLDLLGNNHSFDISIALIDNDFVLCTKLFDTQISNKPTTSSYKTSSAKPRVDAEKVIFCRALKIRVTRKACVNPNPLTTCKHGLDIAVLHLVYMQRFL